MPRLSLNGDDVPTLAAIAVAASCLAAVAHEALGHGGACLASGGTILRLSSVFFRCAPGTNLTDVAGPLGNLVAFGFALLFLRLTQSPHARLFWLQLAAFSLFWFSGHLVYGAIRNDGDWGFLGTWPAARIVAALTGVVLYAVTLRFVARANAVPQRLRVAWLVATLGAVAAAALDPVTPLAAMREAFLEIGVASFGLWFAAPRRPRAAVAIPRSNGWIAAGALALVLFAALFGRGLV
jgi:hypothetical protein